MLSNCDFTKAASGKLFKLKIAFPKGTITRVLTHLITRMAVRNQIRKKTVYFIVIYTI